MFPNDMTFFPIPNGLYTMPFLNIYGFEPNSIPG